METTLYIGFDGCCEAAFQFYQDVLGANAGSIYYYGDTPAAQQVSDQWYRKVVNAEIDLNGVRIAGGDLTPEQYKGLSGFSILLSIDSEVETTSLFDKIAQQGQIELALQKTFWSVCYGVVTDQFGVTWKLSCTA